MRRVPWWVVAAAMPMGLGAWAPLVPARQLGNRRWIAWSMLWIVVTVIGWAGAVTSDGDSAAAGGLIILGWVGAFAMSVSIRRYLREAASTFLRDREAAEQRLEERREAQRIAIEEPDLALELGVGRPDRPGAQDAGLVDVNNATLGALREVPGIDDALATRIVELRRELNGFESVHVLGGLLELDGNAIERLRDRVVLLPR